MDETMMKQYSAQVSNARAGISQSNAQMQAIGTLPRIDTVRSLLELAHGHMCELEQEIDRLGNLLEPVRSAIPQMATQEEAGFNSEPECIALLRSLISRIAQRTAAVRMIADETRI